MKEKSLFKFRAWDKKNQRWMTPEIEDTEESEIRLDLWGNLEFTPPWWEQGDSTIYTVDGSDMFDIMQSTRLKDKNGVEIYEGDIISELSEQGEDWEEYILAQVVWYKDGFYGKEKGHEPKYPIREFIKGEVIGNIYEHNHLLK